MIDMVPKAIMLNLVTYVFFFFLLFFRFRLYPQRYPHNRLLTTPDWT